VGFVVRHDVQHWQGLRVMWRISQPRQLIAAPLVFVLLPPSQVILEQLDCHLVVFSPYLAVTKMLQSDPQLSDLGQNAWAAINDCYRTDLPIVYPPYMLALASVWLASVICSRDIRTWMEGLDVDMNQVGGGCREGLLRKAWARC
jgi:hypothetical protein